MRGTIVLLAFMAAATVATAQSEERPRAAGEQCLSAVEARQAVAQKAVVPPAIAIRAARAAAGGGRIIRASLCRVGDALAYRVTILHRDGRVARVTVEGRSGRMEPY